MELDLDAMVVAASASAAEAHAEVLVIEGVGELLVPLTAGQTVRDLALMLGFPLVVAARPGLGTISHTLLTVEAARHAGLAVAGVVLTPWPASPAPLERSNRATIERLGAVDVAVLGVLPDGSPAALAAGGANSRSRAGWVSWSTRARRTPRPGRPRCTTPAGPSGPLVSTRSMPASTRTRCSGSSGNRSSPETTAPLPCRATYSSCWPVSDSSCDFVA